MRAQGLRNRGRGQRHQREDDAAHALAKAIRYHASIDEAMYFVSANATCGVVLAGFNFNPGQRYSEFRQGDKVAEYGLTALILGGVAAAAAKSGASKALLGFGKMILLAIVAAIGAIGAFFKRLFSGARQKPNA